MSNKDDLTNLNIYSERINSIIKSSIPKIDTSIVLSPLVESLRSNINFINESIALSIQPLLDSMNEFNKGISLTCSSIISDSFKNLKTITSYTTETIESISKYTLAETIDDIYDSLNEFEFNDEVIPLITECKNEVISIKNDLANSKSKEINIHQWIATITAIIGLIISILSQLDNSNEVLIDQNKQIIEIESSKLEKLESIDNSLKIIIDSVE